MTRRRPRLVLVALMLLLAAFPALVPRPAVAAGTADLGVTMVGDRKVLKFGDTITLTATVKNLGPDAATGVVLGIGTSDSYANFGGTCPDGTSSNICTVGTLAPGASVTMSIRAKALPVCCPDRIGVANASVSHDADTIDPVSDNDSVIIETKFVGKVPS
jgi:hypothetical protein